MACPIPGRQSKEIELNGPKIQTNGKRYNVTYSYLRNAALPTGTAEHELSPRAVFWRHFVEPKMSQPYTLRSLRFLLLPLL